MPKSRPPYPAAFRQQMVELVWSGRTLGDLAREFEPSAEALRNWVAQAESRRRSNRTCRSPSARGGRTDTGGWPGSGRQPTARRMRAGHAVARR